MILYAIGMAFLLWAIIAAYKAERKESRRALDRRTDRG